MTCHFPAVPVTKVAVTKRASKCEKANLQLLNELVASPKHAALHDLLDVPPLLWLPPAQHQHTGFTHMLVPPQQIMHHLPIMRG